jgi:hypothetical protein
MNIPALLSKSTISQLHCADTIFVRVLLHSVSNNGQARLRCRNRQYLFEKSHETGCHILDFPMSVWMNNVNPGRYRDQRSICDDFREIPGASFTIHIIGTQPAEQVAAQDPSVITDLHRLLTALNAPEEVEAAFKIAEETPEILPGYVAGIIDMLSDETDPVTVVTEQPPVLPDPPTPSALGASPYTPAEADDLENLHWKSFEKKYGTKKADFITARETALV